MDNIKNTTNNIKAIDTDLEALRQQFPQCFDKDGKFNVERFKLHLNDKDIDFSTESYGLNWLGKSYARLLATDSATTLLREDNEHNALPENCNSQNVLIKGDNLEVLKHLVGSYREKVKMIYIDPPYNTGSDGFVYHDDRKFTVKELRELADISEEQAKRILSFTQSKSNSHSAWLTFMYPRLYIAKQLLRDDGVIFVSIDDNEVAQLRLLMDEIFGEENFVSEIIWYSKYTTSNDAKFISDQHEPILFYSKSKSNFNIGLLPRTLKQDKDYKNKDNDPKGPWKATPLHAKSGTESNIYEVTFSNGKTWTPPNGRYPRYSMDKLIEYFENGELYFNSKGGIDKKTYLSEVKDGLTVGSFWSHEEVGHTHSNNEELASLIGKGMFNNPKGSKLLKRMFIVSNLKKEDLILDFFAGSGTTGDALMQLNAEDGGNRKYILVQIPEPIDPKKDKVAFDFVVNELKAEATIFEITKERLKRAAKKIKEEQQSKQDMFEVNHQLDLGFKVFETTPIWENYDFDASQFDATLQLFDYSQLTEDDIQMLLVTWKTYDGIPLTQPLQEIALGNYTSYYVEGKLYIMHKGFTTDHLKLLLEKIDNDSNFEVKTISAFGYHFESKALREVAENVKSYNNKKNTDIDFIIRY